MAVADGEQQRGDALGVGQIQVGAGFDQRPGAVDRALARCKEQRRQPAARKRGQERLQRLSVLVGAEVENVARRRLQHVGAPVDLCTARGERRDHRPVVFGRGPHQGRLPVPLLLCTHVCAGFEQQVHGGDVARARRQHQRGLAFGTGGAGARPGFQQRVHHRGVAVGRRQQERRHTVTVRRARLGARSQQGSHESGVSGARRPVQRRGTVHLGRVDVGALLYQRPHRRRVTAPCRLRDH